MNPYITSKLSMQPSGQTSSGQAKPDKRVIIAGVLLDGGNAQMVYDRLVAMGYSAASAKYEAEKIQKDPLFQAGQTLGNRLAKREWTLDIYRRLGQLDASQREIPVVDAIAPDVFFRDYYFANRPVKLTGIVDGWTAMERWTHDYLDEKVGAAIVELQANRDSADDYESVKDRHKRHMPMRDVIDMLRDDAVSNDFYITAYNSTTNSNALAALWDDLGDIGLLVPGGGKGGFFWMGPKGTLTPYHHDLTNNLLVQVRGRKRVNMVAAYDVARMKNSQHCFSDWRGEDLGPGPATPDRPEVLNCDIGPGEAIFLPIGWWHHVEGLDMSISMSFTNFIADNDFYSNYVRDTRF